MEKVSKKTVLKLIDDSIKNGKSEQIQVEDSNMPYLRMLVSQYNKENKTKITVRGVHGVYREICAPMNRFFDNAVWKTEFDLIQNILNNDDFMITEEQFMQIEKKLHSIVIKCKKQLISNDQKQPLESEKQNNLLG